jgi:hypothetical protein
MGKEGRRWLFQGLPFSEVVVAVDTLEPWVPEGEGKPPGTSTPPWWIRPLGPVTQELPVYTWGRRC